MSYETLARQAADPEFLNRIGAAAMKEAWANPTFGNTDFGRALQHNQVVPYAVFAWSVSVDNEAAYAYAVDAGNEHPGSDPGVVPDASIGSGVQTHWPAQWPPPPTATP